MPGIDGKGSKDGHEWVGMRILGMDGRWVGNKVVRKKSHFLLDFFGRDDAFNGCSILCYSILISMLSYQY